MYSIDGQNLFSNAISFISLRFSDPTLEENYQGTKFLPLEYIIKTSIFLYAASHFMLAVALCIYSFGIQDTTHGIIFLIFSLLAILTALIEKYFPASGLCALLIINTSTKEIYHYLFSTWYYCPANSLALLVSIAITAQFASNWGASTIGYFCSILYHFLRAYIGSNNFSASIIAADTICWLGCFLLFVLVAYLYGYFTRFLFFQQRILYFKSYKIMDSLPVGIVTFKKSRVNYVNAYALKLLQVDSKNLLGNIEEKILRESAEFLLSSTPNEFTGGEVVSLRTLKDYLLHPYEGSPVFTSKHKDSLKLQHIKAIHSSKIEDSTVVFVLSDGTADFELAKEKRKKQLEVEQSIREWECELNEVRNMVERVQTRITGTELRHYCKAALNATKLLDNSINEAIDFFEMEAGRLEPSVSSMNLCEVLEECKDLLEGTLAKKGIQINVRLPHNLPLAVFTDKVKYRQILLALMKDAAELDNQGSINIAITYDTVNKTLAVSIIGAFIENSQYPEKVNRGKKDFYSIVCRKRLANALGGNLTMESVEGIINKITFTIPSKEDVSVKPIVMPIDLSALNPTFKEQQCSLIEGGDKKCKCPKVLIVDDNEYNTFVLQTMLQSLGINTITAYNGDQAIKIAKERHSQPCCGRFELIFMDLYMPVMDGLRTSKLLTEYMKKDIVGLVPIVGTATDSGWEAEEVCYQSGMSSICMVIAIYTISG